MAELLARGLRFHVQRLGDPARSKKVVFVHGLVMDNLSSFYFTIANQASQIADVLLYDLRGHGKTERPKDGYSLDEMTRDLEAVLTALAGDAPVTLAGNSFGGLLGLCFASRFPARAKSVVLIDAHLGAPGWADKMAATLALQGEERDRKIAESFQSWLGRGSDRKSTRLAETARALVYGTSLVGDLRTSRSVSDDDLRNVTCPVLALYGETSDLRSDAEHLARVLPSCDLRIVPGATHSVLWEALPRVRSDILAWLEEEG